MAARALVRRALATERTRSGLFAGLFVFIAYANAVGYVRAYPTIAERRAFARSFGTNKVVELFYGVPHDLLSASGYAAWRVGGASAVIAALWGLLVAVRLLRGEEDAGRSELVLAAAVARRVAFASPLLALGLLAGALWAALVAGLVAGGIGAGAAAEIGVVTVAPVPVFAGVGALTSQLAPTRRVALELGAVVLVVAFLLRVVADTAPGLTWLRWTTPLGWSEELRPLAGFDLAVLLLPVLSGALLLGLAGRLAQDRDVGSGLLARRDTATPKLRLLGSPTALALRDARGALAAWTLGVGGFALVTGLLSTSFTDATITPSIRRALRKLGGASLTTPAGALGFYFLTFVLAISLFACAQVAAARREEEEGALETLLALPVARTRWLAGRLTLAAGGVALLALVAGALAWVGAASQGAGVPFLRLLEAGLNCVPTALLFLGVAALGFAVVPRAGSLVGYGAVSLGFVWQLFGGLLNAPRWLLDVTPFQHVGLVPAHPFRVGAAAVMVAAGVVAGAAALACFRRRDLASG